MNISSPNPATRVVITGVDSAEVEDFLLARSNIDNLITHLIPSALIEYRQQTCHNIQTQLHKQAHAGYGVSAG